LDSVAQGIKRPGRKADHSPPSSAENKHGRSCMFYMACTVTTLPFTILWSGCPKFHSGQNVVSF